MKDCALSANLGYLFTEYNLVDAIARAGEAGFEAVGLRVAERGQVGGDGEAELDDCGGCGHDGLPGGEGREGWVARRRRGGRRRGRRR